MNRMKLSCATGLLFALAMASANAGPLASTAATATHNTFCFAAFMILSL
jgi:hypothetical protein